MSEKNTKFRWKHYYNKQNRVSGDNTAINKIIRTIFWKETALEGDIATKQSEFWKRQ